jgi:2-haloacid dehalogenase
MTDPATRHPTTSHASTGHPGPTTVDGLGAAHVAALASPPGPSSAAGSVADGRPVPVGEPAAVRGGDGAQVDTVVFDLGNVLVRWDPYGPFEGVLDRRAVAAIFEEIDFFGLNHRLDSGRPWAQARADLAAEHPAHAWVLDRYRTHFPRALPGPVPGTAAVVAALRAAGVRLLGLTNFSAETYPYAPSVAPAIRLLDEVLVSGTVGVAKPDRRIFDLLVTRYGLHPARAVLVDDSAANVAAARARGLLGIRFTDTPALVAALRELGLTLDNLPAAGPDVAPA